MNRKAVIVLIVSVLLIGSAAVLLADPGYGRRGDGDRGGTFWQTRGHGGYGMMQGSRPWGYRDTAYGQRLEGDDAVSAVESYLRSYSADLEVAEIMEFEDNFYAQVEDEEDGALAFELLVDPYSGDVFPEMGPNMMWNTDYGHMSGPGRGFGRGRRWFRGSPSVDPAEAQGIAQDYLDDGPGNLQADTRVDSFPGYYTIHVMEADEIVGMLSVNAFDGSVWYHDWHGDFVGMVLDHGHEE